MVLDQFLNAVPLLAKNQRVLELLRVEQWREFFEQRHDFVAGDR